MQSSYRGSECSKYVSMSIPSWRGHGKATNRFPPVKPGERLFQADVASQNMHIWTWLGCVDTATWTNPGTPWYPNHNMHCHHCRISSSSEPQRLVRPVTAFDNRGIRHDEMEKNKKGPLWGLVKYTIYVSSMQLSNSTWHCLCGTSINTVDTVLYMFRY